MKRILFVIALMALGMLARAQEAESEAVRAFVSAPDSIFGFLPRNTRLDMADYHRYNLPTTVKNSLGGECRIVESSHHRVLVSLGQISSVELAVVPQRADTLVAVIETVLTPVADSYVTFRRLPDWSIVAQADVPSMADFLTAKTDVADLPAMFFKQIRAGEQPGEFIFTNTTGAYYTESERPAGLANLAPALRARFDGRRWKILK